MSGAGQDAVHEAYRTVQQFVDWLGVCQCGDGAVVVLRPLRDALGRFDEAGHGAGRLGFGEPVDHWVYLLDVWGLTRHGSSVHGSWLTPAGERLRAALGLVDMARYADVTDGSWWVREQELQPPGAVLSCGVWQVEGAAVRPA